MNDSEIWMRDLPKLLRKVYKKAGVVFPRYPAQGLVDLIEWLNRVPSESPRNIYKSNEVRRRVLTSFETRNLLEIEELIKRGGNLKPYLGDLTRTIRNRESKKNDFFSSDWGLLHLHLGADFDNKKTKVSRSKRILIVKFEDDAAYFIDVVNHGRGHSDVWGDVSHLRILRESWPYILEAGFMHDVQIGDAQEVSASDYIKLRNSGINVPVVIGEECFTAPGWGIATDGSQIQAVQVSTLIQKELCNAEKLLNEGSCGEAFLVIKKQCSAGFFIPKSGMYQPLPSNSETNRFFRRLLREVSVKTEKNFSDLVAPKRLRY